MEIFQNGKNVPGVATAATIWSGLDTFVFEDRTQDSLGVPRFIQGGLDSETYNLYGFGCVVILIGFGRAD